MIGYDPVGVDAEVDSVRVEVQPGFGVHEETENEGVIPAGRPKTAKETGRTVPAVGVTVIVFDTDCPSVTILSPPVDSAKVKGIALLTVTETLDVVWFPAASRTTAAIVCEVLMAVVVSQFTEYGEFVSSAPRLFPSSLNWTPATTVLSEAFAEMEIVPETMEA